MQWSSLELKHSDSKYNQINYKLYFYPPDFIDLYFLKLTLLLMICAKCLAQNKGHNFEGMKDAKLTP